MENTDKTLDDLAAHGQRMADPTSVAASAAALFPAASAKSKLGAGLLSRTSLYGVDPTRVSRREGWNPRIDFGEIDALMKSIKANGVLNPIRVKRLTPATAAADFELIDGDRRLTAILKLVKAGHAFPDGIPATLVDKAQEDLTSLIQMFEANSGKAFSPIEEAQAYQRMKDAGLTVKTIAQRIGKDAAHIAEMIALLEADDSVQDAVQSGAIGKTQAKRIANEVKDKAKQAALVVIAKAAGKGKAASKAVAKTLDADRRARATVRQQKAAGKGKTLKMRALSDSELSDIGMKLSQAMADRLIEAGKGLEFDVRDWVSKDDALALAFTYGALEALKAAAGVVIDFDI